MPVEASIQSVSKDPFGVLLVSGTLGSGKTTFINRLCRELGDRSYVVIENDIGQGNVDANRLEVNDPSQVLPLTAGCICCADLSSLRHAVQEIRDRGLPPLVVVETTGIANPLEIASMLHEEKIQHRTLITLDVRNFERNQKLERLKGQIEAADILLLTHWEGLTSPETLAPDDTVLRWVASRRPDLRVHFANRDGELSELALRDLLPWESKATLPRASFARSASEGSSPADRHPQHPGVFAASLVLRPDAQFSEVLKVLRQIRESGAEILRAKGTVEGRRVDVVFDEVLVGEADGGHARLNLITTAKVDRALLGGITAEGRFERPALPSTGSDLTTAEAAEDLVNALIDQFPRHPFTPNGNIAVSFDADEAEGYLELVSPQLRDRYYQRMVPLRLEALHAAKELDRRSDPMHYHYLRYLGGYLTWLKTDKSTELACAGLRERVEQARPAVALFMGLALMPRDAAVQLGALTDERLPFWKAAVAELERELRATGTPDPRTQPPSAAAVLFQKARRNLQSSPCLHESWHRGLDTLEQTLYGNR